MIIISFIKIIKEICELTYNCKDDSNKTDVKNNIKMNRNSAFNGSTRKSENFEFQNIGFDEFY